ncbi:hypothetical protein B0H10DRAFT_911355 [Mycena sp. CBHHK59/15]|nr:hypothetical protein B0H10DRAFT_911355 [Mycena sp. CBHHK59/15]
MPRFANKLEPHDRGDKILHHATLAARLLTKFSDDNSNNPYLKGIAGISLLLLETVQTVKTNRSQCLSLIERIHEIITAIINLCGDAGSSLSPAILRSLAQFFETLQKVYAFIRSQQNTGMFKRILRATETAALLEDCNKGLEHAVNLFKIQARLMASAEIAQARTDAEKRYDELADLIGKQVCVFYHPRPKFFMGATARSTFC